MRVVSVTIDYARPDTFRIYPFGDMHLGTQHCAESKIREKVREIKEDKRNLWVDMGDSCEFISPNDPRWDVGALAEWLNQSDDNIAIDEADYYCEMLNPIKMQCIGKLKGNHEVAIHQHSHINVQKYICKKLGIEDLDYSAFIKFIFRRKNSREAHIYKAFITHGAGCAVTSGAKLQRLQRLMDNFDADIIAQGHVHDIVTYTKPYLSLDSADSIQQRVKVGATTGCWFRTYTQDVPSSYGEQKNYPPVMIGCPVFTINPDKGLLKVEG